MKTLRLEQRNHPGPARSIRPRAVNQDNIFRPLRGIRLSESSHVESGRQDQHRDCDQNGSVHLREFHLYLLVKLTVAIRPEQPSPRNWTMVSPILSYRLQCLHAWATQLSFIQLALKIDRSEGNFPRHARYEGIVDTMVQLPYASHSGLIATDRETH